MSNSELNVLGLINCVRTHLRVIIIISFASAVAGAVFYLAFPKKYAARTEFILRNPVYGDKNNIYSTKVIDYFAGEDDLNRVILMSESELIQMKVINNMNLAKAYKLDTSNPKDLDWLKKKFNKNLTVIRTEYQDLILTFVDTDPKRAADVTNECVKVLEKEFSGYYWDMRMMVFNAMKQKQNEEDSNIKILTDSLIKLRNKYEIYDILSPARHNIMSSTSAYNGKAGKAEGIELIQNIEAVKDEMVSDHAIKTTMLNEYDAALKSEFQFPMMKVITEAKPPVTPKGLGGILTVIVAGALGFMFSTIVMSIVDNVKTAKNK